MGRKAAEGRVIVVVQVFISVGVLRIDLINDRLVQNSPQLLVRATETS
jgi:hypothetical protein